MESPYLEIEEQKKWLDEQVEINEKNDGVYFKELDMKTNYKVDVIKFLSEKILLESLFEEPISFINLEWRLKQLLVFDFSIKEEEIGHYKIFIPDEGENYIIEIVVKESSIK